MVLTTLEKVLVLKSVSLFRDVDLPTLAAVAEAADEVAFDPGTVFVREGDDGDCLYVVVDGEVSVHVRGAGEVARRGAGTVVGEMAVISSRPRSADCIAATAVLALRVSRAAFTDLMARDPTLARAVVGVLAERLDEAVANLRTAGGAGASA